MAAIFNSRSALSAGLISTATAGSVDADPEFSFHHKGAMYIAKWVASHSGRCMAGIRCAHKMH